MVSLFNNDLSSTLNQALNIAMTSVSIIHNTSIYVQSLHKCKKKQKTSQFKMTNLFFLVSLCYYELILYELILYELILYELILYELILYELILYELILYELILYELILYELILLLRSQIKS